MNASTDINQEQSPQASKQDQFTWGDGLTMEISPDQLSATIEVDAIHSSHYTVQDIERFLKENSITFGIERDVIEGILENDRFNQKIQIATGDPAVNGEDGYVKWDVDLSILEGSKLVEKSGRVDYKEVSYILPVKKDQRLAVLIPPTEGRSGKNVLGNELPGKPGKPVRLQAGKGVRISDDGNELFAAIDGVVCKEGGKYIVDEILLIKGDVNLTTGNITSSTTVVIKGGVLSDFRVSSEQDIHIDGLVEGAEITAQGNIYLNGGIQGNEKARVKAGGEVRVKFVNNAKIEAAGTVHVNGSVNNSVIQTRDRVIVEGKKATIMGGHIMAEKEISASVIGSEMGVRTILEIGLELKELHKKKVEELQKIQPLVQNYKKMQAAVKTLNQMRESGRINPQQSDLRLRMIRAALQLQNQVRKMEADIDNLDREYTETLKQQRGVVAKEMIHPGTIIRIMGEQLPIKNMTSKAVIAMVHNKLQVFGYQSE
ncbi:MAG: DUF342 domain-containing protein [bacterium]|jgi:uncharacterized protein (DUF342 family)